MRVMYNMCNVIKPRKSKVSVDSFGCHCYENSCGLSCWPKCEQDYGTISIVNWILMIRAQLLELILHFLLIYCVENYSEFNIYPTLGLKIMKPPPWNPASHELSNSTKSLPNFVYFILLFVKFLGQNCSIFNNSCVVGLNTTKPPQCTHTHWTFQPYVFIPTT
jgi:hypothetical protein